MARSGRAGGPGGSGRSAAADASGRRRQAARRLSHVDARGRVKMVDVGDKPVTQREAVARGSIAMSREARRLVRAGARQERRSAPGGAPRRHHGGQADGGAHPALPSAAAVERPGRADADRARLRHRGARPHDRADRRRDGSADRRRRRRADHLRHGQGGRQDDGDRRHPRDVQERRPVGHVSTNDARLSRCRVAQMSSGMSGDRLRSACRHRPRSAGACLDGVGAGGSPLAVSACAPDPTRARRPAIASSTRYPHDRDAYTQGLEFVDGVALRKHRAERPVVDSGKCSSKPDGCCSAATLPQAHFGEGITIWRVAADSSSPGSRTVAFVYDSDIVRAARVVHLHRRGLGPDARRDAASS